MTVFQVRIDNLDRTVSIDGAQLLLSALLERGVRFAYSCQAGNCGACKCQLVAGEVDCLPHSDGVLSDAESARGLILACRARPRSDLVIRTIVAAQDGPT